MDGNRSSQQPKMQLPSTRFKSEITDDRQRGISQQSDKEEPHKSVSMAASSSYLMDTYVVRKPLLSAEQHMCILKKTHSQKATEKESHFGRSKETDMREPLIPDKCSLSRCDSSASPKIKDPTLFLSATGLQAKSCWEKSNSRSPFHDRKSAQSSLPSSFLHVQKVHFPLRPPLTSTVLSPTCSPCLGNSKMSSPVSGEESSASPYQANYWACAIPKALPPFRDRNSADWNPNMEYQALLDYTYPLKPEHVSNDWDSTKQNEEYLLTTHPSLQDSGIELDQLCSSMSLSGQYLSERDVGQSKEKRTSSADYRSPDPQLFPTFSDGPASSFMSSPTGSANVFMEAFDCCTDVEEENHFKKDANHYEHNVNSTRPGAFMRKVDEEFWPLPEQLEVFDHLSRQVRDLTAELSRPASCESTEQGTTSTQFSIFLQKQGSKNFDEDSTTTKLKDDEQDFGDQIQSIGQKRTFQTGEHREEDDSGDIFDRKVDPAGGRQKGSRLMEAEAVVGHLGSANLSDSQRNSQVDQEEHNSLMKHIQVFCSHLELLIQQLYAVSQRMEQFSAPTEDMNSIRSSLAEYQRFQKELSNHQPLTSSVLHSGQHLLNCINATTPFLRDTLLLIEKQSGVLQTQSDHFFSSIMSAVDGLTQPRPVKERKEKDAMVSHKPSL